MWSCVSCEFIGVIFMDIRSEEYKSAFEAYIRKGIPIDQSLMEQSLLEAKN